MNLIEHPVDLKIYHRFWVVELLDHNEYCWIYIEFKYENKYSIIIKP